ncbi:MAG: hypothetical protein KME09_18740 [Pleurocapsa minor HA4230-MV1]|nr:hypothetical protein [Pleurocapsa minor HA4230-MV1]
MLPKILEMRSPYMQKYIKISCKQAIAKLSTSAIALNLTIAVLEKKSWSS